MKQRSWRINEQGPDGEEVSHEEQQHQADIESKNMAAKQQKATESRKEVQRVSRSTRRKPSHSRSIMRWLRHEKQRFVFSRNQ